VRFAPSPTGFLHIGGVRTALFNWLYARKNGGQFLLRIEDTDLERSDQKYTDDILTSLRWLGIDWDEEPIYQSKRLGHYRAKAEALVVAGHAYACTCSEEDVEAMRTAAEAEGRKPMYDRRCRDRGLKPSDLPNGSYVIRAKVPLSGAVAFTDLIRGTITVQNSELDDFVLIRSSGAPTYNLSVVIDDVDSRMTHIIRGDDHINNTPKQLHLYTWFGYPQPAFAHLPMILGPDKKKLSKRHGAVSANVYRADGYLPDALLNFLARLGWSHGDQEVFTVSELKEFFGFDHVQHASGVFNPEKLSWINGEHLKRKSAAELAALLVAEYGDRLPSDVPRAAWTGPLSLRMVAGIQPKLRLLSELIAPLAPVLKPGRMVAPGAPEIGTLKWNKDPAQKSAIQKLVLRIEADLSSLIEGRDTLHAAGMDAAALDLRLRPMCADAGVKLGELMQPIRLAVTGVVSGATPLFEAIVEMPWAVVRDRLRQIGEW